MEDKNTVISLNYMIQIALSLIISSLILAIFGGVMLVADMAVTGVEAVKTEVQRLMVQDQDSDSDQLQSLIENEGYFSVSDRLSSLTDRFSKAKSNGIFSEISLFAYLNSLMDNSYGNSISFLYSKNNAIRAPPDNFITSPLISITQAFA